MTTLCSGLIAEQRLRQRAVKANTPPVKNPDLIQPGWVLRIPPEAGSKTA
jgi:nucleoid-associated protein YgaU